MAGVEVSKSVPLEDIRDLFPWVQKEVSRFAAKGEFTADEIEDMVGQGVLILYEIHARWDRTRAPRFSAYAISLFQKRMIDWYRSEITSSGRGHVPQSRATGRGAIIYHGMTSLNSEAAVAFSQDRALTHFDPVEA